MRMWNVFPGFMCDKHLLGEHCELHMFVGTIKKKKSVEGYLKNGLLQIDNLFHRHQILVNEMLRRNFKHNSPLPKLPPAIGESGWVYGEKNIFELRNRCKNCREKQDNFIKEIKFSSALGIHLPIMDFWSQFCSKCNKYTLHTRGGHNGECNFSICTECFFE